MSKKINPAVIIALKEALTHIYWRKKNLKDFLYKTMPNELILSYIIWDNPKRDSVSFLIDNLEKNGKYDEILLLCISISKINDFSHLRIEENGIELERKAINAVKHLKSFTSIYEENKKSEELKQKAKEKREQEISSFKQTEQLLEEIKQEFFALHSSTDSQGRGYKLENIMYRLFQLYELDAKSSFKVLGEQIDGAFTLDGTEYLFEGKWQQAPVNKADLAAFQDKIKSKLDNTLGLFLSIGGFSNDGVEAFSRQHNNVVICMDGLDMMAIFDKRCTLPELINRTKQIASRTGQIYVPIKDLLNS